MQGSTAEDTGGGHRVPALDGELIAWCEGVAGGRVLGAQRLAGGNRRQAWAVDVEAAAGGPQRLFMRVASADADLSGDPYDLWREAAVYRALVHTPVRIPRILATHPARQAVLMERVDGDANFRDLSDPAQKLQVAQDFMRELHRLHAVDPGTLGIEDVGSIEAHVRGELRTWRGMYDATGRPDTLLETAFAWLDAHVPPMPQRAVLVHGDAGPGNFMFAAGRIVALIDWELWHLGDPVEDIAWLSMRSILEPMPELARRVAEYEALAGAPVDRSRLLYHRIFVTLRVCVIRHRADHDPASDGDKGNSLLSRLLNRRLLVESLAQANRLAPDPYALPAAPPTPRTATYDHLLGPMRSSAAVADPLRAKAAKSTARLLKYLQQYDRLGPAFERDEAAELAGLLQRPVAAVEEGRLALAQAAQRGQCGMALLLGYCMRQSARETALGAPAMGALARRSFDPLEPSSP